VILIDCHRLLRPRAQKGENIGGRRRQVESLVEAGRTILGAIWGLGPGRLRLAGRQYGFAQTRWRHANADASRVGGRTANTTR